MNKLRVNLFIGIDYLVLKKVDILNNENYFVFNFYINGIYVLFTVV